MNKLVLLAIGVLGYAAFASPAKKAAPPPPTAPRKADFTSDDVRTLSINAMVQLSREMQALGQLAVAQVYMDQSTTAPPGTVSRALQHVADEFAQYGDPVLASKLRKLAASIYTDPVPST